MSNPNSATVQVIPTDETESHQIQSDDLLFLNIEQIRKIQEMEKQLEFWKNKCVELKYDLDKQKVQAKESSDEKEDLSRETKRKQQQLEGQVTKLQKDLENAQNQNKSLKMQLSDKDKQIQNFEKQTQQHFDELNKLKEKIMQLKDENYEQQEEKKSLEAQLLEVKKENTDLQNKSTEHSQSQMSPEQYLDYFVEEKDLQELQRFSQMVYTKCMQIQFQQMFENYSTGKGGSASANGNNPMQFPPNGLMNGMNNNQFMIPGMMPNMPMGGAMNGGMPQMPNQMFTNLQQYPQMATGNAAPMGMNNNASQGSFGQVVPNGFSNDYNNRP